MIERIRNIFIEEAVQQLESIKSTLDHRIQGVMSHAEIEKIFLAMHSIKGSAPMVGFKYLPIVSAPVEKVYVKLRKGEINVSEELIVNTIDIIQVVIDVLKSNSDNHLVEVGEELVIYFKNLGS